MQSNQISKVGVSIYARPLSWASIRARAFVHDRCFRSYFPKPASKPKLARASMLVLLSIPIRLLSLTGAAD